jgi:F0F1-type ATP synthase delta subunit
MSIVLSKVAEPYAEAFLDLAKSTNSLKETTNDQYRFSILSKL